MNDPVTHGVTERGPFAGQNMLTPPEQLISTSLLGLYSYPSSFVFCFVYHRLVKEWALCIEANVSAKERKKLMTDTDESGYNTLIFFEGTFWCKATIHGI